MPLTLPCSGPKAPSLLPTAIIVDGEASAAWSDYPLSIRWRVPRFLPGLLWGQQDEFIANVPASLRAGAQRGTFSPAANTSFAAPPRQGHCSWRAREEIGCSGPLSASRAVPASLGRLGHLRRVRVRAAVRLIPRPLWQGQFPATDDRPV